MGKDYQLNFVYSNVFFGNNVNLMFIMLPYSLRYNCLDRQAAILESAVLKLNDCQVKKLL